MWFSLEYREQYFWGREGWVHWFIRLGFPVFFSFDLCSVPDEHRTFCVLYLLHAEMVPTFFICVFLEEVSVRWLPVTRYPLFRQTFPEDVVCMLKMLYYKRLFSVLLQLAFVLEI
jgi:hypothetical protein